MLEWGDFASTLGLVLVAELGDKTQLAVVAQTCRHRRPWSVFVGASAALVLVTGLGAVSGRFIAGLIAPKVMRYAAASLFVAMGVMMAWRARKLDQGREPDQACGSPCEAGPGAGQSKWAWDWQAVSSTFGLLLVAELGDKTQLAVLGLAGAERSGWAVFAGGVGALLIVTGAGVLAGGQLCKVVPQRVLVWASSGAFLVMGLLIGASRPQ